MQHPELFTKFDHLNGDAMHAPLPSRHGFRLSGSSAVTKLAVVVIALVASVIPALAVGGTAGASLRASGRAPADLWPRMSTTAIPTLMLRLAQTEERAFWIPGTSIRASARLGSPID